MENLNINWKWGQWSGSRFICIISLCYLMFMLFFTVLYRISWMLYLLLNYASNMVHFMWESYRSLPWLGFTMFSSRTWRELRLHNHRLSLGVAQLIMDVRMCIFPTLIWNMLVIEVMHFKNASMWSRFMKTQFSLRLVRRHHSDSSIRKSYGNNDCLISKSSFTGKMWICSLDLLSSIY